MFSGFGGVTEYPRQGQNGPLKTGEKPQECPTGGNPGGNSGADGGFRAESDRLAAVVAADPRLAELITVWPRLSEKARDEVLGRVVDAMRGTAETGR
jgi:hypothetical protein